MKLNSQHSSNTIISNKERYFHFYLNSAQKAINMMRNQHKHSATAIRPASMARTGARNEDLNLSVQNPRSTGMRADGSQTSLTMAKSSQHASALGLTSTSMPVEEENKMPEASTTAG